MRIKLPPHSDARIDSAELTDLQPAEYRADLVVLLVERATVGGIVIEVQLAPDERKRFVWPAYVANLRARLEVPVCLFVVTPDERVARWAAKPIDVGGGSRFLPLVLGPTTIPEVADEGWAREEPELAVLSAIAHGRDPDSAKSARIAVAAQIASLGLDADRSRLYFDLVLAALSDAARQELKTMDPVKYEYQSEFARRYVAQGRADLIIRQLTLRFGTLTPEAIARIAAASIQELDGIGERVLTAQSLEEALRLA